MPDAKDPLLSVKVYLGIHNTYDIDKDTKYFKVDDVSKDILIHEDFEEVG